MEAIKSMTDDKRARERQQRRDSMGRCRANPKEHKKRLKRESQRRYRANRDKGVRIVGVPVSNDWIDGLIDTDHLLESESEDLKEVASAISGIVDQFLASMKKTRSA
jgi:hypothetical protein